MRIKWGNTQRSARTTLRTQCVYHVNVSPSLLAALSASSVKYMVTITCHTLRLWVTGVFRPHCSNTPCLSYTSSFYSFYNSASLNPLPLLEYDFCFLASGLCWSSSFHQKYFPLLHLPIYNLYGVFTPLLLSLICTFIAHPTACCMEFGCPHPFPPLSVRATFSSSLWVSND